jgi:hypothetical protein
MKRPSPDVYLYLAGAFLYCGATVLAMICITLAIVGGKPFGGRKRRPKVPRPRI